MIYHWSFSDSRFPQVSRTLLSILADLDNAVVCILADLNVVVWMVATRPLISNSSSPFINPLVTVSNAPITIGITVTFIFHSFFGSLARSRYLSFFSPFFSFTLRSAGTTKSTIRLVHFFFVDYH